MSTLKQENEKEYRAWYGMIARCCNVTVQDYRHYGGRGISVCERWRNSFVTFFEDVGKAPSPRHSFVRKDINGNFEPSNCLWKDTGKRCAKNKPLAQISDDELEKALLLNRRLAVRYGGRNWASDLEGAGNFGIVRAMQNYDRSKADFSSYVYWYIRKYQLFEYKKLSMAVYVSINDYTKTAIPCSDEVLLERAMEEAPDFEDLHYALSQLTKTDRETLIAYYFYDLKGQELSKKLRIGERGCYGRIRAACKRLKVQMRLNQEQERLKQLALLGGKEKTCLAKN